MSSYTAAERKNIIRDIAHWKTELETTGGREFTDDDLAEYVADLEQHSDAELRRVWNGTVGEWVLSRGDVKRPEGEDAEAWLDNQFDRLKAGEDVAWGYVVSVHV